MNDISHCYHATATLGTVMDQGDGKGIGGNDMMARAGIGRVSKGTKVHLEKCDGWHTVAVEWTPLEHIFYMDGQETLRQTYRDAPITTVPQHFWCSACLRAPKDAKHKPFYGRLDVDGAAAGTWELSATWYSGNSWRQSGLAHPSSTAPSRSLGSGRTGLPCDVDRRGPLSHSVCAIPPKGA